MEVMLGTVVHYGYCVGIMLFTFVFSAFVAERAHVPVEPVIVPEEEVLGVAPGEALGAHHAARHTPPVSVIPALEIHNVSKTYQITLPTLHLWL